MQIPKGKITTYKELAKAMDSRAWRAVGSAMSNNPNLMTVPCHRVIRSDGRIGSYALGEAEKERLLIQEGIPVESGRIVNFQNFLHDWDLHQ